VNDGAREVLRNILRDEGSDIVDDQRRLRALLADRCAGFPRESRVLAAALEYGVPSRLGGGSATTRIEALARELSAERGIGVSDARWAVETWAAAMAVDETRVRRPLLPPDVPARIPGSGPPDTFPIPDYWSLTVGQILPRLSGLSVDQLDQVRDRERQGRNRTTVLDRIERLRARAVDGAQRTPAPKKAAGLVSVRPAPIPQRVTPAVRAPDPPARRSRVPLAVAAAGIAALVAVLVLRPDPPFDSASTDSTSPPSSTGTSLDSTSSSRSTSSSTSSTTATTTSSLNASQQALMTHVPTGIPRSSCSGFRTNGVVCDPPGAGVRLWMFSYASSGEAEKVVTDKIAAESLSGGQCDPGVNASFRCGTTWHYDDTPGVRRGNVAAWVDPDGRPRMLWSQDDLKISAELVGLDTDMVASRKTVYAFWVKYEIH
jgi:hypothetical protein